MLDSARRVFQIPAAERALVRLTLGRRYGGAISRLAPNPYQYPLGSRRAARRYGLDLELDLAELMDWYLYFGFRDPSHERLLSICRPGDTVLDVGANMGITVLRGADRVGPSGRVIGLEPDPSNFAKLSANVERAGRPNVQLFNVGAADKKGTLYLRVRDPHNVGMNTLVAAPGEDTVEVPVTTLDELVETLALRSVDVVKMDIEGSEAWALAGATKTLRKFRPRLFVELDDSALKAHGSSGASLFEAIRSLDYRITDAETRKPLPADLTNVHTDIVADPI